ncbi:translational GTPase TypA [Mesoplasma entomophilum]|uniref:Large ribosomal subunit assembly factor BipA n=1 Tax=Mesoplasma coleopterae TaxID=324078 RepID=A0A2K8P4D6_9MOLU|nr:MULTISPECIES: translational GTPase TypA [Mesoplasma]ATZ21000.1 GTP-binding protein [Mesoplasma coleopterae]AVN60478.1 translational GTPase TypA [Mesoplasma entomophilum]AVN62491.1 translational GTPase TypA [Mesoplasma coleopterae]AVN63167.1 translational GTPase TypA [Mesoplasma coleopterae]
MSNQKIINIAVIAHVDAGKSTLVDALLKQGGAFRDNQEVVEQIMDSNDQERERGITIYSKNCAIEYKGTKINIVDTPGHADFSSEVERIMKTVDTVILLVDSSEGPMPQTRFVLSKALELGLNPILMINKIDKKDQRAEEVVEEVLELFMELDATDEQLEFKTLYGIAREGIAQLNLNDKGTDLSPMFDTIIEQVGTYPIELAEKPLKMQVSSLAYDSFIGRLGIGRIFEGKIAEGQTVSVVKNDGEVKQAKISKLTVYQGLNKVAVKEAFAGDIITFAGIEHISIGDTINELNNINPMEPITIEEPTMSMNFLVNTSPFAGKVGKFVTSRNIKERLEKELEVNVGLKVEPLDNPTIEGFKVLGRGELHLSVLIEQMRREGFELAISKPEVIFRKGDNGTLLEPMEKVILNIPTEYSGTVINKLNQRKGLMTDMDSDGVRDKIVYNIPLRALIGFRSEFTNDTHGEGIMVRSSNGFEPYKGEIESRKNGVLISMASGKTLPYALNNLEERGILFVGPQVEVYDGMIVGQHSRDNDLEVNPTTGKKLTNTRASGSDDSVKLTPPKLMTLEEALEYIEWDELVEVTPDDIRLRKRWLSNTERRQHRNDNKKVFD